MTTLYIRYPSRASVDLAGPGGLCQFALAGDGGTLQQQGAAALGSLDGAIGAAQRVVLLLSAADVTLLRVAVPPLSAARLKAALPNLVEEQVLGDPAECVLAAGPRDADGKRTVAVVQRAWLEALVKALLAQGARTLAVLPAQLCLPLAPGGAAAALDVGAAGLELTLCLAPSEGMGLNLPAQPLAALQMARDLAADAPLTVYVAQDDVAAWQAMAASVTGAAIAVEAQHWAHWISASKGAGLDLMPALGAAGAQARDWRRWRWPLRLALLAMLVNVAGVNIEWLRLKREAAAVRSGMLQTFKAVYPNETALFPAAQMRRNIAAAKLAGGQVGADEFTALAAALGEALGPLRAKGVLAGLDYRERTLLAKIKPDTVDAGALAQVKAQLATRQLSLSEASPGNWEIRAGAPSVSLTPGAR